jgi:bifunctional UDP-N-acetylglucosamine pyrophosphorylase / glucosamine-1-phosphate N-acetyltransferase
MPLSIVILAAGQGKRMLSDLPKVLQPLANKPLLDHVLAAANRMQADAIYVVYGHGGERVKAEFADASLQWVYQAEQLGTGHAVMQAMPSIPDDHTVLVLFGDVPLIREKMLRQLIRHVDGNTVAVLSVMLKDPTGYGRIVRDHAGTIFRIVEHKDASTKERAIPEANTGIVAAPAKHLREWLQALKNDNAQGEYYLTDIITLAVKSGCKVAAEVAASEAEVLGVNDKVQLAELEAALRHERATQLMLQGATLADPARIDIRGEVTIGKDVFIDVNVVLVGKVRIGDRTKIGPNCYIKDTEIGADTEIFPCCVFDRARVGSNCNVGPFARLRPEATLADEVHIGNFVEIKKSRIGKGSKANHLTYVGDAIVGERANLGAGTITVNYDGANKWQTEIGDNAFIGSGSMLVAPVKIGAGANTGAGSTITKDAPAGKLTLARARQLTLDHWKRPTKKT